MAFSPEALRAARVRARLTQEELAAIVHVHPNSVRHWESGQRRPSDESLFRLAYKLHVEPYELTTERPEPAVA